MKKNTSVDMRHIINICSLSFFLSLAILSHYLIVLKFLGGPCNHSSNAV